MPLHDLMKHPAHFRSAPEAEQVASCLRNVGSHWHARSQEEAQDADVACRCSAPRQGHEIVPEIGKGQDALCCTGSIIFSQSLQHFLPE